MRAFPTIRRVFGLSAKPSVIKAPNWLVARMVALRNRPPPTQEQVDTQMKFSRAMTKCLDEGMTYEEAKTYVEACADDIRAGLDSPWRKKVGENRYEGSCGCVFNADGKRVHWCGDHY
jgi:hypothetical protein